MGKMLKPQCLMRGIKLYIEEELERDSDEIGYFTNIAILKIEEQFNNKCEVKKIYVFKDLIELDGRQVNGYYDKENKEIRIAYIGYVGAIFPKTAFIVTMYHELIHSITFKYLDNEYLSNDILVNKIVDEFNANYYAYKLVISELNDLIAQDFYNMIKKRYNESMRKQVCIMAEKIKLPEVYLVSLVGFIHAICLIKNEMWQDLDGFEKIYNIEIFDRRFLIEKDKDINIKDLIELRDEINIKFIDKMENIIY